MNVPPSALSQQHGIAVQFRSCYPYVDTFGKQEAASYVIPPMTPVFKNPVPTRVRRTKRVRYTSDVNEHEYQDAHAQYVHRLGGSSHYTHANFLGVSTDGLPDGASAAKHPEQATHFTAITRGLVTVMCCYEDIKDLRIGDPVRILFRTGTPTKPHTWSGIDLVGSATSQDGPFSLELTPAGSENDTIGHVISMPGEKRFAANECTIMLR